MFVKGKITTKQVGLYLTAIGQTLANGSVKRAYSVEQEVHNEELAIAKLVENGMTEDEARYLHGEIDFQFSLTTGMLVDEEEVTS